MQSAYRKMDVQPKHTLQAKAVSTAAGGSTAAGTPICGLGMLIEAESKQRDESESNVLLQHSSYAVTLRSALLGPSV